jgi:hypothetical protein
MAVGGLAQIAVMVQNGSIAWTSAFFALICFAAGFALHLGARHLLGGLEE